MTILRVDGEAIQALGAELRELSEVLAGLGETGRTGRRDLGHQEVAAALDALLGNWTLVRGQLARGMDALGELAGQAGAAYLFVEEGIVESLGCTPRSCVAAGIPR